MPILRITAVWNGFRGAPGYSNFYFQGQSADEEDAAAHGLAVREFFQGVREELAGDTTVTIQGTADNIDETNGNIIGQVDFDQPPVVLANGSATYSAATGAVVNWMTGAYKNGRRVKGRTFLVPLGSGAFDGQGDLAAATLTVLRDAAQGLVANPGPVPMVVWSRPKNGAGGSVATVTSARVPDLGAILRSRRD